MGPSSGAAGAADGCADGAGLVHQPLEWGECNEKIEM